MSRIIKKKVTRNHNRNHKSNGRNSNSMKGGTQSDNKIKIKQILDITHETQDNYNPKLYGHMLTDYYTNLLQIYNEVWTKSDDFSKSQLEGELISERGRIAMFRHPGRTRLYHELITDLRRLDSMKKGLGREITITDFAGMVLGNGSTCENYGFAICNGCHGVDHEKWVEKNKDLPVDKWVFPKFFTDDYVPPPGLSILKTQPQGSVRPIELERPPPVEVEAAQDTSSQPEVLPVSYSDTPAHFLKISILQNLGITDDNSSTYNPKTNLVEYYIKLLNIYKTVWLTLDDDGKDKLIRELDIGNKRFWSFNKHSHTLQKHVLDTLISDLQKLDNITKNIGRVPIPGDFVKGSITRNKDIDFDFDTVPLGSFDKMFSPNPNKDSKYSKYSNGLFIDENGVPYHIDSKTGELSPLLVPNLSLNSNSHLPTTALSAGKSRRRRHRRARRARRTSKNRKSRKGRKMRRSYK